MRFDGFREKDLEALRTFIQAHFNASVQVNEQSILGRNWGDVEFLGSPFVFHGKSYAFLGNGSALAFKHGGKQLFEIPLSDVAQVCIR